MLFADDTTLINSNKDPHILVKTFNEELKLIVHWLNANCLSLNIDKTNFMVFRPKHKNDVIPDILINDSKINEVYKAKFLGVIIDSKLSWNEHVKFVIKKVSKCSGIIIKARKYFNTITLVNLYNTLILPFISYCVHIWGAAANLHLNKIHVLQKKIIRIISGLRPRTHTKPFFDQLKIMTVHQLYSYYVGVFMYKLFHKKLPPIFNMFERISNVHNHSTRQIDSFYIQYSSTLRTQRTIKISGPKLWNLIIRSINIHCKISTFKANLKKFILSDNPL